jgi:hypothetical protein
MEIDSCSATFSDVVASCSGVQLPCIASRLAASKNNEKIEEKRKKPPTTSF